LASLRKKQAVLDAELQSSKGDTMAVDEPAAGDQVESMSSGGT
jgi:hypothetical protein